LKSGKVLIAGGVGGDGLGKTTILSSAELFSY
jgi:hypothetical protein